MPLTWLLFAVLAAAGFVAFYMGRTQAVAAGAGGTARLNSQPNYHGYYLAMCTIVPAAIVFALYLLFGDTLVRNQLTAELPERIRNLGTIELSQYLDRLSENALHRDALSTGNALFDAASRRYGALTGMARLATLVLALLSALGGFLYARGRFDVDFRARARVEDGIKFILFLCAGIAILTTIGIVISLLFETIRFFSQVSIFSFLFGTEWNAQTGADFGALPLFFGTFMIAGLAMLVAAPIGLYSAIYLSEYSSRRFRSWVKPILELLAGIPTVVYGFFALQVVAPAIRTAAIWINDLPFVPDGFLAAQPTSALAAGLVMGIMIIPFVSSLSDDVINAVPQSLRDGAYAMGATKSETVRQVVMPAALPGVIAALLLAVSRAIGETMIVVMAAGQRAQITADPTADVTTITVQIVALLTGDTEFDSPKTLSAFALGFVLFIVTLIFNLIDPRSKTVGFGSEAALQRLRKRHAAERRFKFYGQLAIGLAITALVILLFSIGSQAASAFSRNTLSFDIPLNAAEIMPEGSTNPEDVSSNVTAFNLLVQKQLSDQFLGPDAGRDETRELYGLVTRLAVLPMARWAADHPEQWGKSRTFRTAISDDIDLYLKGSVTARKKVKFGESTLTATGADTYELTSSSASAFEKITGAYDRFAALNNPDETPTILLRSDDTVFRVTDFTLNSLTLTPIVQQNGEAISTGQVEPTALVLAQPAGNRTVSDRQIGWTWLLSNEGRVHKQFNTTIFTNADSTYPELAGAAAAIAGSLLTMLMTGLLALPVGIFAAIYLEEFAPKNRMTDFIEVNINNLAAVPSIVFGLLGAAVFINFMGMPRSVPLVGGLVLGLLVMPTVIIASRAALKSVPPSIRSAALGVGASKTQSIFHHVLPLAAPGIMTGAIIGMARALGETAPLLLIGMVAFVAEVPSGPTDESTVLPVLIYKWSTGAERAWEPMTAAAIVILLVFLILMNAIAIILRRRFERRW